jgi:hypothetical protein
MKNKIEDFVDWLEIKFKNTDLLKSWFLSLVVSVFSFLIAFIPLWVYFLLHHALGPVDFWQNFALLLVWCLVLGWMQIISGLVWVVVIVFIWEEHGDRKRQIKNRLKRGMR